MDHEKRANANITAAALCALMFTNIGCRSETTAMEVPTTEEVRPGSGGESTGSGEGEKTSNAGHTRQQDEGPGETLQDLLNFFSVSTQRKSLLKVDGKRGSKTEKRLDAVVTTLAKHTNTDEQTVREDLLQCTEDAGEEHTKKTIKERVTYAVMCMLARRARIELKPPPPPTTYEDAEGKTIKSERIGAEKSDEWNCSDMASERKTRVTVKPEQTGGAEKQELLVWADATVTARDGGGCKIIVGAEIDSSGTAARAAGLEELLGVVVEVCDGTCKRVGKTETLGELAQTTGKLRIRLPPGDDTGIVAWSTPGEPLRFEDLAQLYCAPQSTEISASRPFGNLIPGSKAMCPEFPRNGHEATSLTTRRTVAVVLSHGPGWQGHGNPNAWYENLVETGPETLGGAARRTRGGLDVAIFENRELEGGEGSEKVFRRIAHARLDGDMSTWREVMRNIGSALGRWEEEGEKRRRWNELDAAIEGIEREDSGSGALAAVVVVTAAPRDGGSCTPPKFGGPFVVAWSEAWGPVTCAPRARLEHEPR